jgi:hypothetical protein
LISKNILSERRFDGEDSEIELELRNSRKKNRHSQFWDISGEYQRLDRQRKGNFYGNEHLQTNPSTKSHVLQNNCHQADRHFSE